jgi:hypothetical protein
MSMQPLVPEKLPLFYLKLGFKNPSKRLICSLGPVIIAREVVAVVEQHVPVEDADVASDPKVALVVELGGVLVLAVAACKE